jgi:hypothetical protein
MRYWDSTYKAPILHVEDASLNTGSTKRIGAVEHHEWYPSLSTCSSHPYYCRSIGVISRTDIYEVSHHDINTV